MQKLETIYNFADRSLNPGIIFFPWMFVALGLGIFYYNKRLLSKEGGSQSKFTGRKYGIMFGIFFASATGLISIFVTVSQLSEYFKTKHIYENKRYEVIEGNVEAYHPMPPGGHDNERFKVKGISFEFSDYDVTNYGYKNARSKGGVIREDLFVKIAYFNNGDRNVILKLEIEQ